MNFIPRVVSSTHCIVQTPNEFKYDLSAHITMPNCLPKSWTLLNMTTPCFHWTGYTTLMISKEWLPRRLVWFGLRWNRSKQAGTDPMTDETSEA